MYSGVKQNQAGGYGSNAFSEEQEHKGKIFSVSLPHHDLWMEEEWDLQQQLECLSSRSHLIRKWTREKRCERLKAQQQMTDFGTLWGRR